MKLLDRHIPTLGRLFLVFFFVANSGFTLIQQYCTMARDNHGAGCMASENVCPACRDEVPAATRGAVVTGDMACRAVNVAGGVNSAPTIVDNTSVTRPVPAPVLISHPALPIAFPRLGGGICLDPASAADSPPPSVETYVLNATFLI